MRWSRPPLALPPAESPSTMNSSVFSPFSEQSESLWGIPAVSRVPLRLISSRARRAASRAWAASTARVQIFLASAGFSCSQDPKLSVIEWPTNPSTSGLISFSLVWLLNCGSVILTEMIAVSPSLRSSPEGVMSLSRSFLRAYRLMTRVSAFLKPSRCVPPSGLKMLLLGDEE